MVRADPPSPRGPAGDATVGQANAGEAGQDDGGDGRHASPPSATAETASMVAAAASRPTGSDHQLAPTRPTRIPAVSRETAAPATPAPRPAADARGAPVEKTTRPDRARCPRRTASTARPGSGGVPASDLFPARPRIRPPAQGGQRGGNPHQPGDEHGQDRQAGVPADLRPHARCHQAKHHRPGGVRTDDQAAGQAPAFLGDAGGERGRGPVREPVGRAEQQPHPDPRKFGPLSCGGQPKTGAGQDGGQTELRRPP